MSIMPTTIHLSLYCQTLHVNNFIKIKDIALKLVIPTYFGVLFQAIILSFVTIEILDIPINPHL